MEHIIKELESVTIRFAGDSGDGMQLSGTQFSNTSAEIGLDVNTFPDYPAEIRAPEGTLYGVSAYQIHVGKKVNTPGDKIDVLVAMNASSLKVNLPNLDRNSIIIANKSGFGEHNLELAGYTSNPLENGSLDSYQLFDLDITKQVNSELENSGLSPKSINKTKNLFALGMIFYIFDMPIKHTLEWLQTKFAKKPAVLEANLKVFKAGYHYGETTQSFAVRYHIKQANLPKGTYRNITGNNAIALGLVAASRKAKTPLFLGSYPITPATDILHYIAGYKRWGVKTFQAEDEIAAVCAAIGASFGGYLGVTTTSGPGLSLKTEGLGLATMLELPLVVVDVQRGGPSTGIPTKLEQTDFNIAMFGRHGESQMPILAAATAADCFDTVVEAVRIALKYMTPVMVLSDGYLGQGSEPWRIPSMNELPDIPVHYATDPKTFAPYRRDPDTLARMWALPGTPGCRHLIGGLEKEDVTGIISQFPENHEKMVKYRAAKIEGIAKDIPLASVYGEESGELLILGWGSTYGAIKTAFDSLRSEGHKISYCNLRYLNPLPRNMKDILSRFKKVLMPENNLGQVAAVIRSKFLVDTIGFNMVEGRTFTTEEIKNKVLEIINKGDK